MIWNGGREASICSTAGYRRSRISTCGYGKLVIPVEIINGSVIRCRIDGCGTTLRWKAWRSQSSTTKRQLSKLQSVGAAGVGNES